VVNIVAEGGTPHMAMLLAGHSDITMSSHYYSNIANMIECKTYRKYKAISSKKDRFEFGKNFYPLSSVNILVRQSRCSGLA